MRKPAAILFASIALIALSGAAGAETTGPVRYDGAKLTVRDVIGEVRVTVDPKASDITVTIDAKGEEFALLSARAAEGGVVLTRTRAPQKSGRDWKHSEGDVTITVTVPKGAAIQIDDMVGKLEVGDLDGPLTADIRAAADIKTGRLSAARLSVSGAASIHTGDIAGKLDLNLAGAGDVDTGTVQQGANISIAGFGNVDVAGVNGPVTVRVSGAGDVDLNSGTVDMLDVAVSGMASVHFDGTVRDRKVSTSGLATVTINGKKVSG